MTNILMQKAHAFFDFILRVKYIFTLIFFCVSFATFGFLYLFALLPEALMPPPVSTLMDGDSTTVVSGSDRSSTKSGTVGTDTVTSALPSRIIINSVGINAPLLNPQSTEINVLDYELKKGVVRYPGSGTPGSGNMLLFGHNTSFKIVNNQAYKSLNGLKDTKVGDEIVVEALGYAYVYKVFKVRLTSKDEALVQFNTGRNMLTVSTCNVFGAKEERYVVEANFVEKREIGV